MIKSWRNAVSRKVWNGERPNQFRGVDLDGAIDLLLALNAAKSLDDISPATWLHSGLGAAKSLDDISPLASVGLHKLRGDRKGQWAMTINGPWRICFEFRKGDAYNVEIANYHKG